MAIIFVIFNKSKKKTCIHNQSFYALQSVYRNIFSIDLAHLFRKFCVKVGRQEIQIKRLKCMERNPFSFLLDSEDSVCLGFGLTAFLFENKLKNNTEICGIKRNCYFCIDSKQQRAQCSCISCISLTPAQTGNNRFWKVDTSKNCNKIKRISTKKYQKGFHIKNRCMDYVINK